MDHYQEISLLPDPEFPPQVLMNALFGKLHRVLVGLDSQSLGVSFPDQDQDRPSLGGRLRLHGSRADLERLAASDWLSGMRDHTFLAGIRPVPGRASHVVVRRVQAKSNPERLRRRLAKRRGLSLEEARCLIPEATEQRLGLPFLTLRSHSTGHTFRLFIEHSQPQAGPVVGLFSQYGLSLGATVPWF